MKKFLKFAVSMIICQMAGLAGSFFTMSELNNWYAILNKPSFTPTGYIIGIIWMVLFFLMGGSLYLVWSRDWKPKISPADAKLGESKTWNRFSKKLWLGSWKEENAFLIFVLQFVLNIWWSVIFFGLQFPGFAFFELLALWVAILYTIANFYRISKAAAYLLIPYILWVSFAGVLNFLIWRMN